MRSFLQKLRRSQPEQFLRAGVKRLAPVFSRHGFRFKFHGAGKGSGGRSASGEMIRGDRRVELHFRGSLGMVTYHVGESSADHRSYMKALGMLDQCKYPGYNDDPLAAFDDLAHDLRFAKEFLDGDASVLKSIKPIDEKLRRFDPSRLP
jgi:hypothetical protein